MTRSLFTLLGLIGCVPPTDKPSDTPADDSTPAPGDDSRPAMDSGHSTSPDDSDGGDSGGGDSGGTGGDSGGTGGDSGGTGGDSTAPDDTGTPSGDGDLDLDCDGSKDDGRAIKLCWSEVGEDFALPGGHASCDVNGDDVWDLFVTTSVEGIMLIDDFSTSREVSFDLWASGEDTLGFGSIASCGGDRDDDGYEDMLAYAWESPYSGIATVYAFDGPVVAGTTTDDAMGALYQSTYGSWMNKFIWAQSAGDDGGDGVLMGGDDPYEYSYGSYSYAWLQGDLVGEHEIESSRASFTTDIAEDLAVGAGLDSADMDGDGTAEALIGIQDDSSTHKFGAILSAPSDSEGATLWAGDAYSYDDDGIQAAGGHFSAGDVDEDGYTDIVGIAYGEARYDNHTLVGVYYHPDMEDHLHALTDADALVDLATEDSGRGIYPIVLQDFNGDGRSGDVAIVRQKSVVYLLYDPPSGYLTEDDITLVDVADSSSFSYPTDPGDLNGDGLDDLAFVATGDDEVYKSGGAIYVLFGGSW